MAAAGLNTVRIDLLWAALEPQRGQLDDEHMRVLDEILDAAERHGLTFHPTLFIGGEVGDAYWDIPWAGGANPHADPALRRLQAAHAAALGHRWRDKAALIAWDLNDEPPLWLFKDSTTDEDARVWTDEITNALRAADPDHLITIGTASQEVDHGPFRADVVADRLDFCCVHPYPIYSPELYPDALLARRMTHAGAFETALARGAGCSVMVHEYGASSTQFDPERIATFDRLTTWTSFGAGAIGFYAWCWTDADPVSYSRAPYVRMPHETQFGVTAHDGERRPRLRALSELASVLGSLDLDGFASDGPTCTAAIPVPHEYVRPYDEEAYGLNPPAGPYLPAEAAWDPDRDVKPLVRAWINAYTLAARAGVSASFPRENLDGRWPDAKLLLVPAPLTTTTNSLLHLRTSTWQRAADIHAAGGTLYLSCSADTAIPGLERFAGVRIIDRAPVKSHVVLRFVEPFGDLNTDDEIRLPAPPPSPHLRGALLEPLDARVLAVDDDGNPVLTIVSRGTGATVVCGHPLELILASIPDAHGSRDNTWRLYNGLVQTSGAQAPATVAHADVTVGVLSGPDGAMLIATNHGSAPIAAPLRFAGAVFDVTCIPMPGARFEHGSDTTLQLDAHAVGIVTWRSP
jgi:endo-1,4-beta-mannosidase